MSINDGSPLFKANRSFLEDLLYTFSQFLMHRKGGVETLYHAAAVYQARLRHPDEDKMATIKATRNATEPYSWIIEEIWEDGKGNFQAEYFNGKVSVEGINDEEEALSKLLEFMITVMGMMVDTIPEEYFAEDQNPKCESCLIEMVFENRDFQVHSWVCQSCGRKRSCDHQCCGGKRK